MKTRTLTQTTRSATLAIVILSNAVFAWGNGDPATLKEAYQDHFLVGVAINRTIPTGTAVKADNVDRTLAEVRADTATVLAQFNQIAPENDLKWQLIHPREGADGYDFAPADAFVNFGVSNNLYVIGHTLVWHGQTPTWVFAGTNPPPNLAGADAPGRPRAGRGGYTGPRASREELLARMREHIHTVVGRYKGKIKAWDVVNEAIADGGTNVLRNTLWLEIIGPDYIAKAFQFAHEADPDAILRYNDYGLENTSKRRKLITLIKSLQEQGVPIHAIGSQAHVNVATTFQTMDQALAEMATLGLPIHITELDVNSAVGGQRSTAAEIGDNAATTQGGLVSEADKRQAEAYANLFRAFLKHKEHVKMVTLWGVNDAVSWRADGRPLLFDGNNQPKPAFHAVLRAARSDEPAKAK
jgi:endo-1,4-beta-xylanase